VSAEYRVEYVIQRRQDGDDDFTEIGFGSSGAWASVVQAGYMVETALQFGEWETLPGMPDPAEVSRVTASQPIEGSEQ
jgi:hypothetical protein